MLELSPADAAYLHGLAGHLDVTRLPPLAQIRRVLGRVEGEIRHAPFPIAGEAATVAELGRRRAGVFDLVFDSRLPIRGNFSAPEAEMVLRFQAYNRFRRHEPFYLGYPAAMREQLIPADYALRGGLAGR